MNERMRWSEAEAIVQAYRAEQGLVPVAARKPRFVDRSGALSAGIALAVTMGAMVAAGPALLARHPLTAMLAPAPEAAGFAAPKTVIFQRVSTSPQIAFPTGDPGAQTWAYVAEDKTL